MAKVGIQIDEGIFKELILRKPDGAGIAGWIETIVQDYLLRTQDDENWHPIYYQLRDAASAAKVAGLKVDISDLMGTKSPGRTGLQWKSVFLPNGTKLRMTYRGGNHYADIANGELVYEGQTFRQLHSLVTSRTTRNAMRGEIFGFGVQVTKRLFRQIPCELEPGNERTFPNGLAPRLDPLNSKRDSCWHRRMASRIWPS